MANISQNVNIEMLEKLPDGTYKRKYPKTRSDTGVTFDEHLAEKASQNEYGHIRLSDIPSPIIATEEEALDGINNTKMMTPLRVKQAIYGTDIGSWTGVQEIVRRGLANQYFEIGNQLASRYDGRTIIWEVIGINADTPTDSTKTYSMTIQTKDILEKVMWNASNDNRYINSDIRSYLNGDFLSKLDPELSAILGAVDKKVAVRDSAGGGQDSFSDKVFLLSRIEVDGGKEGTVTGEFVYPYYAGISSPNRIKQLDGSNNAWWLRSPNVGYTGSSRHVRRVLVTGLIETTNDSQDEADRTVGLAPACVIV